MTTEPDASMKQAQLDKLDTLVADIANWIATNIAEGPLRSYASASLAATDLACRDGAERKPA